MITTHMKILLILLMVLTGALDTIDFKFQNSQYVYEGPMHKLFFHPYIQTWFMFLSEFMSLPVYLLHRWKQPALYEKREKQAQEEGKKLNMNRILLLIPAVLDFLTSTLQFMALNFISASAYQMLRGGAIITTFIFSFLFFKATIHRPQVIGTILAFLGILVVGLANILHIGPAEAGTEGNLQIVGYILIIVSLVTNGLFFAFEQKLFETFHLEPLEVVGYEGMFGFSLYLIMTPILSFIPCSFGMNACVYDSDGRAYMEGWTAFQTSVGENSFLYFLIVFSIFSVLVYNVTGVSITKYINALARAIAQVTKIVLVWLVGIIITITMGHNHPNYRWQSLNFFVIILQLLGFTLLVFGNLIYNQLIRLKIGSWTVSSELNEQT